MGQEALEAAIFKYRGIEVEAHDDDEGALVCSCFGISDSKIRRAIIENNLTTVEQVTNYVKAGGGCGTCLVNIEDLIESVLNEAASIPSRIAAELGTAQDSTEPKKPLTTVQKISLIQQVLTEEVRPVLLADGGDVELFDVDGDRVLVTLKGACGSCSSSTDTLKYAIEARLRTRILPTLVVEAV
jgi:NifU-like protein